MLRPLEWSEYIKATPQLTDMTLGVFNTEGEQIYTAKATEESPELYRASVVLEDDVAGTTVLLRWRSVSGSVLSLLTVFITGERLPAESITVLNQE